MMHSAFHDGWFCGPGGTFPGFHGLFTLFFLGLALYLIYLLFRNSGGAQNRPATGGPAPAIDPLGILDRRYAAGEIDRQEYLERKKDLGL